MIRILLMGSILLLSHPVGAEEFFSSENGDVADGNAHLVEGKTNEALEKYDAAARALPGRGAVHLNRGLALARSGDEQLDKAMQAFQVAADSSTDDAVRARAASNLGNAFYKKQDYEKAVALYKQSLMAAPGNKDVAWNLELARQKKKEQDEQKKDQKNKENQDQQNQDQQNQDQQNQDQENQDQQDRQQDQQDDENKDSPENKDPSQDQQAPEPEQPKPEPRTKQDMQQVLDSLDDQQKNLMKEMAKQKGAAFPAGRVKDW